MIMTIAIHKCEDTKDSVAAILGAIIKKNVQSHYSDTAKGINKKNFGDTNTFRHMRGKISFKLHLRSNIITIKSLTFALLSIFSNLSLRGVILRT